MIKSCRDKETAKVFALMPRRKFQAVQASAEEVLVALDSATALADLALPGLRLEKLSGDRKGQYSIRVRNAVQVEIVDYH